MPGSISEYTVYDIIIQCHVHAELHSCVHCFIYSLTVHGLSGWYKLKLPQPCSSMNYMNIKVSALEYLFLLSLPPRYFKTQTKHISVSTIT